ncbi:uncharacterized protein LOC112593829 [Melanaphis sacchari]|uniref:uncharacterized protein LOC112593829 n=1 Tax=Melanaphis sacchari TaxID=742174 RepID=UPI000DC1498D|nr:uncharacterized protein LOC112593829 [Melanaphis sacchari]XP_025194201.1 uncharacterized protein LOC112593829 [Melanaphis sacchari]
MDTSNHGSVKDMGDIGEVLRDVTDLSPEDLKKQNRNLQKFLVKVIDMLKEKADRCVTQEKHIEALTLQTNSLKEVVDITKHMLSIRNTEVNRMTEDLESLQGKINEERSRHSAIIEKMNLAAKLNDELRSEYKQQSERFENMRVKYDEKFSILSDENKRLQDALPTKTTD